MFLYNLSLVPLMFHRIRVALTIIRTIKNWPTYFLERSHLLREKTIFYTLKAGPIFKTRSNTPDLGTILEIWAYHVYTPPDVTIKPTDIVFDIGAHIGTFSIFAARAASHGTVYSFEPIPENFNILQENIKLNRVTNIQLIPFAVTDQKGEKNLLISASSPGVGSFYQDHGTKQRVSSTTLSSFIQDNHIPHIDFLKMDCEGAEYDILFHCPQPVLRSIKKISMEYHDLDQKRNHPPLISFLQKHGFIVEKNPAYAILYARNKRFIPLRKKTSASFL